MSLSTGYLTKKDSEYLALLRAISILVIVCGHLGGFWFFKPWSEYLQVAVSIFFFISGAVSYNAFLNTKCTADFLIKRVTSLLVPYYCICFFSLFIYVILNVSLPAFSFSKLTQWLTINPNIAIMSFPLGQIWFLHTLLIISIISPIYFLLFKRKSAIFLLLLICPIMLSLVQVKYNIASSLIIAGHNFFKPLIHSLFFCTGFLTYNLPTLRTPFFLSTASIVCFFLSLILVEFIGLNPDYELHTYSPDIYYVAGSLCSISLLQLFQPNIMSVYNRLSFIHSFVNFLFKHTFSIYLVHSFAIFFAEEVFGLVHPQQLTVEYIFNKVTIVFIVTFAMAPILTSASSYLTYKSLEFTENARNLT